jgi:hypothetical protein
MLQRESEPQFCLSLAFGGLFVFQWHPNISDYDSGLPMLRYFHSVRRELYKELLVRIQWIVTWLRLGPLPHFIVSFPEAIGEAVKVPFSLDILFEGCLAHWVSIYAESDAVI